MKTNNRMLIAGLAVVLGCLAITMLVVFAMVPPDGKSDELAYEPGDQVIGVWFSQNAPVLKIVQELNGAWWMMEDDWSWTEISMPPDKLVKTSFTLMERSSWK